MVKMVRNSMSLTEYYILTYRMISAHEVIRLTFRWSRFLGLR